MAKQGEVEYLQKIGPQARKHAFEKPWSDDNCGRYLSDLGTVCSLIKSPPGRLLDLGVGSGWTSVMFALRGYDVVGQDISADMIELARENAVKYQRPNVEFVVSDYEDLHYSQEFDVAVFYDSLHYAIDPDLALEKAFNGLSDGGVLITVEPGKGHGKSQDSIQAMQRFDVTEQDMPPKRIISIGKNVGFKNHVVYQRRLHPVRLSRLASVGSITRSALDLIFARYHGANAHCRDDEVVRPSSNRI